MDGFLRILLFYHVIYISTIIKKNRRVEVNKEIKSKQTGYPVLSNTKLVLYPPNLIKNYTFPPNVAHVSFSSHIYAHIV